MKNQTLLLLFYIIFNSSSLDVPLCSSKSQLKLPFTYIDSTPDSTTTATLCHDNASLYIKWTSVDEEIVSTYTKCNDPLYNQDAVEIFIATKDSYPKNYFEFQVSPKSQLFFADITNPAGTCSNLGTNYYSCIAVLYGSEITISGWNAWLKVGLGIIGRGKAEHQYMINMFRIDKSSKKATRYLTWQPTFASPPCFHKPAFFQQINLVQQADSATAQQTE